MSARHTTIPLAMNGTAITAYVNTMAYSATTEGWMRNGTLSSVRKLSSMTTGKASDADASRVCSRSPAKSSGRMYTSSAPTVIPNRATESATNAKWYSIVTLKMRVRRISYISVASATRNSPI